ncbi:MAG: carboxypeptidase-like regulatory domain-containing protein [Dysgonamonadaceae bacterium]|jgi:hypothetical protein|nr:carboxypeptidase-like regulatory domain-containing protein [Dysgonamonadaceae bacterium]
MNTIIKNARRISLLVGFILLFPTIQAQNDTDYYTVSGLIKDKQTQKKIGYVTVSATGTNIGTIANEDGEFTLKLNDTLDVKEIELSCLGYYNTKVSISKNNSPNQVFYMNSRTINLKEVNVLSWKNARELIEIAIEKIAENYSITPNLLTGFYRETAQKGKKYINISEAVIHIYKSSYKSDAESDRVQVLKGRKLVSPKKSDTLSVKLLGGPNLSVYVDIVKNPYMLLDKEILPYYTYKLGDATSINDRMQYVVYFSPEALAATPLYRGTYYIDQQTLAFTRVEFQIDMRDKNMVTSLILKQKPKGLRFSPEGVEYVVGYKYQDGKSYLNYIHNEIKFKCDWKIKLFATSYSVVSEMVVTDNQKESVLRIPLKESFSMRKSLSEEAIGYFDENFWGAYNIIEPTESLESAVSKLKKDKDK